jgi:hypothetical protein
MGGPRESDTEDAKKHMRKHYLDGDYPAVRISDRKSTDTIMCLVFIAMLGVMSLITGFAFGFGNIDRIATKYDMDGQYCKDDHPYKLFTRIMPTRKYYNEMRITEIEIGGSDEFFHYSVCVAQCPNNGTTDINFLPNIAYPNTTMKLNYWDQDTDLLMGFCVPDLANLKEQAIELFNILYEQMDE